ncbi:MAG: hypothetical protein M1833_004643 [Piccolia ochrophora]|nr:MAG: hypothetical protein M1833_004643 [Piccolia ochrophora]
MSSSGSKQSSSPMDVEVLQRLFDYLKKTCNEWERVEKAVGRPNHDMAIFFVCGFGTLKLKEAANNVEREVLNNISNQILRLFNNCTQDEGPTYNEGSMDMS